MDISMNFKKNNVRILNAYYIMNLPQASNTDIHFV